MDRGRVWRRPQAPQRYQSAPAARLSAGPLASDLFGHQGARLIKQVFREHPILAGAFVISYLGATAIKLLGAPRNIAFGVGLPALVLSGWAACGHFITLDDDYPGGWSNPGRSKEVWRASLLHLLGKLALFAALLLVLAA